MAKLEILSSVNHNFDGAVDGQQKIVESDENIYPCWPIIDTPIQNRLEQTEDSQNKVRPVTAKEDKDDKEHK